MSAPLRKIIIIGATSAIAQHCARLWSVQSGTEFVLVGRDALRTQQVADDLRVRNPANTVEVRTCDFLDTDSIRALASGCGTPGAAHIVLIAHGTLPDQADCQSDLDTCRAALEINGVSPALFAEAFATRLQAVGGGTLAIIGSVAGDRGRRSNYTYGAAKGLVTRYAQGLQHRFSSGPVKVVLIKPGPTDTPMTASLGLPAGRLARVEDVAQGIVGGIERGVPELYVPGKWWLIMMVIRHLPRFVFARLNI
jgi:decaprenylphospho-beta-D-erythro-pentofuranosid-2-ulose 2-reductase